MQLCGCKKWYASGMLALKDLGNKLHTVYMYLRVWMEQEKMIVNYNDTCLYEILITSVCNTIFPVLMEIFSCKEEVGVCSPQFSDPWWICPLELENVGKCAAQESPFVQTLYYSGELRKAGDGGFVYVNSH